MKLYNIVIAAACALMTLSCKDDIEFNVFESDLEFSCAAASREINLNFSSEVSYQSDAPWCTVEESYVYGSYMALTVGVTANESVEERACSVTITSGSGTKIVHVTQQALDAVLVLSTNAYQASEFGEEKEIEVLSNTAWSVSSSAEWCALSAEEGRRNGYFTISIAPNTAAAPHDEPAVITVTALNISKTITIAQEAPAQFGLTLSDATIDAVETVSTRVVRVHASKNWNATSSESWCAVEQTDAESLKVSIEDNTDGFRRTAVITVATEDEQKTIAVTQRGGKVYLSEMWAAENLGEQPYGTLYHGLNDEIECPEGYVLPSRTDLNALNGCIKRFDDTTEDNPGQVSGMWFGLSTEAVNAATADDPQNCIFLPATGFLSGGGLNNRDACGYYWSRNATKNSGYLFRISFCYYSSGTSMVQEVFVTETVVNKRAARCIKEKYSKE